MPWPVPHPISRSAAAVALVTLMLVGTVAAVGFALADPDSPTGAPVAVGRVESGESFVNVTPRVLHNQTYDLVFTNLTEGAEAGAIATLYKPNGEVGAGPRALTTSDNATYEVTFPSFLAAAAGRWTLLVENMTNLTFEVASTSDYNVTLSHTEFVVGDMVSFVVRVTHATYGYDVSGAEISVAGRYQGTTNASGQFVYTGPAPSVGTHRVTATRDFDGDGSAEVVSWTQFTVHERTARPALVSITDANAAPGFSDVATVRIQGARELGALTLELQYDASVVKVDSVQPASGYPNLTLWWYDDAANATLRMLVTGAGAQPGPSGSFALAHVVLNATGAAGTTSRLDLTLVEAAHSNGTRMPAEVRDGTFRSGLSGDADGDGDVDVDDLHAIARSVLREPGARVDTWGADFNQDGRVSGIDAMLLEQRLRTPWAEPTPVPPPPSPEEPSQPESPSDE